MIATTCTRTEGKLVTRVTLKLSQHLWAGVISLVGDFSDWNRAFHPLRRDRAGRLKLFPGVSC